MLANQTTFLEQHAVATIVKSLLVMLLTVGEVGTAAAQDQAILHVSTNAPDAILFADSLQLGRAAHGPFRLESGRHRLRLISQAAAWSAPSTEKTVRLAPRETLRVTLRIPHRYRIASTPYAADVYLRGPAGREHLGVTPLLYDTERPLSRTIVVEKSGYDTATIEPDSALWNEYDVRLVASAGAEHTATEVDWEPPERSRTWIDVAALGTALVAGAVAIHYKFKADRIYEDYRSGPRQGDESLRPQFERYDQRSAVALGVMQAGVTVFAVRLALR